MKASPALKQDTRWVFLKKGTCSRTLLYILNRDFGDPLNDEERAIDPLAGGFSGRDSSAACSGAPQWPPGPRHTGAAQMLEKFLKFTGYEFLCTIIAGRNFDSVEDHSEFIREGGCDKLILALADVS